MQVELVHVYFNSLLCAVDIWLGGHVVVTRLVVGSHIGKPSSGVGHLRLLFIIYVLLSSQYVPDHRSPGCVHEADLVALLFLYGEHLQPQF